MFMKHTTASGLTLPISFRRNNVLQRDIDFSVLIILTNLWKLLRQPEGPFYTTINIWQFVCLPDLHLPSLDYLRRGFRRTPTNHTMRLTWTLLTMPSLNYTIAGTLILHSTIFRWRQVKYSCDTSSFTLSRGLVPPFWSLVLISLAVTSAVYAPSSWITWGSLVDPPLHWVLCRWLAGVYQRITTPLFYSVNFLNP